MAKFKIHMKRDAVLSSDAEGMQTSGCAAAEKDVIISGKYMSEAVVEATKTNHEFYPVSWECIEADIKTPEELAEEAANKKIVEEWKAKQAQKKESEIVSKEKDV